MVKYQANVLPLYGPHNLHTHTHNTYISTEIPFTYFLINPLVLEFDVQCDVLETGI